jgi:hypothetical protein
MRATLVYFGASVTLMALGCQPESKITTSRDTNKTSETAVVAQAKLVKTPEPEAATSVDTVHSASEDHGHGPGGMGPGPGGMGAGMGRGPDAMGDMREDMTTLHAMFADRDKIKRTVTNLPDGAEAVTESDDKTIASMIQEHVPAMEDRVLGNRPLPPMTFHPIFVKLIERADDYTLSYEETEKGIKVTYQSDDPYVVMLVQEHAKLVSRFIKNGMEEIHTPYTLPEFNAETKK